jgi:hypothetical protein
MKTKLFFTTLLSLIGLSFHVNAQSFEVPTGPFLDSTSYVPPPPSIQSIISITPYKQCDPPWNNNQLGSCPDLVCQSGCAMTCAAILLQANCVNVDPGQLNSWLTNNNYYLAGCSMDWTKVPYYPGSTLAWAGSMTYSLTTLKSEINGGNPVIVHVDHRYGGSGVCSHFVVVYGYNNSGTSVSDFLVTDPGTYTCPAGCNLSYYTICSETYPLRLFHNVSCNPTSLLCNNDFACGPPAPMALAINSSCISSSCSTVGATPPSPDIPITCSVAYQSARYDDDVWFSITPTTSSPVTITATPTSNLNNFDLVLSVYHGNCSSPTQDYCADVNYAGGAEQLTFTPTPSTTYLIRVFSYGIGNIYSGNFNICAYTASSPDLTITSNSQTANPGVAAAGQFITAGCSEDNLGNGTSGINDVTLWLSSDAILNTNNDVYLGQISTFPSLAPSANSLLLTNSVQIPPNTAQGTYYLFFWADGNQAINESTENNNFASFILLITDISEIGTGNNFIVFPNPSLGVFTLSSKITKGEISICNVVGETVFSETINTTTSTIDLSDKPNGIYFITVKSEMGSSTQKIIIQK